MKSLTICMTTARREPEFDWLIESLLPQIQLSDPITVHLISRIFEIPEWPYDRIKPMPDKWRAGNLKMIYYSAPKPNVWQGPHRLPKDNWWSVSNARNTALCLCQTEWIAFLDDRCVLQPGWLDCIKDAMTSDYIMAGSYEKRTGMTVENGFIKDTGALIGLDCRQRPNLPWPVVCPGEWLFGCNVAGPVEKFLQVNGYPERCDGMGFEDVILGLILQNNGFRMKYDSRAKMIEDRTPEKLDAPMKRTCKEKHPHDTTDKAHTLLRWVRTGAKRSENDFDLRELRAAVQQGKPFPVPDPNKDWRDWFDGEEIKNMK